MGGIMASLAICEDGARHSMSDLCGVVGVLAVLAGMCCLAGCSDDSPPAGPPETHADPAANSDTAAKQTAADETRAITGGVLGELGAAAGPGARQAGR